MIRKDWHALLLRKIISLFILYFNFNYFVSIYKIFLKKSNDFTNIYVAIYIRIQTEIVSFNLSYFQIMAKKQKHIPLLKYLDMGIK